MLLTILLLSGMYHGRKLKRKDSQLGSISCQAHNHDEGGHPQDSVMAGKPHGLDKALLVLYKRLHCRRGLQTFPHNFACPGLECKSYLSSYI